MAGDVGAIGCVQADARLERVRAFVKVQDGCSFSCSFCVVPLVRGASRSRPARRRAAGDPPPRRAGPPRGRAHRDQPRLLPRPRRRLPARATWSARRETSPAWSGCGCPRSRSTTSTTSSSARAPRDADRLARTCTCRCSPATTAYCARWAGATRSATYLRRGRAARRLQPDDRRDRRLPGRGRGRLRAHAASRRRGRDHEGARLPVLAPARARRRRPRTPFRARSRRSAGARLRSASHEACLRRWRASSARDDAVLVDRPGPRLRRRLLALARPAGLAGRRARPGAGACRSPRRASSVSSDCLFCRLVARGRPRARRARASSRSGTSTRRPRRTC